MGNKARVVKFQREEGVKPIPLFTIEEAPANLRYRGNKEGAALIGITGVKHAGGQFGLVEG